MKFRSDKHRKAVFANMFGRGESKGSKVNSNNIRNFEVKPTKTQSMSPPKVTIMVRGQKVELGDVKIKKDKKGELEACIMCRSKEGKLKKRMCRICRLESKEFLKLKQKEEEELKERKKKLSRLEKRKIRKKLDEFEKKVQSLNKISEIESNMLGLVKDTGVPLTFIKTMTDEERKDYDKRVRDITSKRQKEVEEELTRKGLIIFSSDLRMEAGEAMDVRAGGEFYPGMDEEEEERLTAFYEGLSSAMVGEKEWTWDMYSELDNMWDDYVEGRMDFNGNIQLKWGIDPEEFQREMNKVEKMLKVKTND